MTPPMQTELQAAEALEKFALSMSDITTGAGSLWHAASDGLGQASQYIGDTASSAADYAGTSLAKGWEATPDPLRRSVIGAAGGAALMTLVEALRSKKKKQYGSRAMIGAGMGAILPHMGDTAGTVAKLAAVKATFDISSILSDPNLQAAAPTLIGAGLGATGGALVGKKGRRLSTSLMGGLAGGAIGAATPSIRDAIQAYSGQRSKQQSRTSGRLGGDPNVTSNKDTTLGHTAEAITDGLVAVAGTPIGAGALIGGGAGTLTQAILDSKERRTDPTGKDYLRMHQNEKGIPDRKALAADIASHMPRPDITSADVDQHPDQASLPKTKGGVGPDYSKSIEMLVKKRDAGMLSDANITASHMPASRPKHTWDSLFRQDRRNNQASDHYVKPIDAALDQGGPRSVRASQALDALQGAARDQRLHAAQSETYGGLAKRHLWGGRGQGYTTKGMGLGAAIAAGLPLISNLGGRLLGSNENK